LEIIVCNSLEKKELCKVNIKKVAKSGTSLFQHVGYKSSLDGKIQKITVELTFFYSFSTVKNASIKIKTFFFYSKDANFTELANEKKHKNPDATVETTLKSYYSNTIDRVYKGDGFMWAFQPKKIDYIKIHFDKPFNLSRYS
jgi:hypothetical protein